MRLDQEEAAGGEPGRSYWRGLVEGVEVERVGRLEVEVVEGGSSLIILSVMIRTKLMRVLLT